ncbi:MAG: hypothetical protein K6E37_02390 [Bacteroidales bacterium]|nr:hypothetical protein [Bacteroidales bacterium]
MRRVVFMLAALLSACTAAYAYCDEPDSVSFKKSFSLELGSGQGPLHVTGSLGPGGREAMAEAGQIDVESGSFFPLISVTEAWRVSPHWELCLTESISWRMFQVKQYDTFGIDPDGKPRYDTTSGQIIGWKSSIPYGAVTFQARVIWSPKWKVTAYSAMSVGLTSAAWLIGVIPLPIPGITPVGLRYGGEHFYCFAEATLGPIATFGHGGLGWRF